jgi:hypothetical protein
MVVKSRWLDFISSSRPIGFAAAGFYWRFGRKRQITGQNGLLMKAISAPFLETLLMENKTKWGLTLDYRIFSCVRGKLEGTSYKV